MKVIFILILAAIIAMLFCGCYTQNKAKKQFGKAAITYPEIPAQYCSITYPVKDSIVKDTVNTTDTIYDAMVLTDTIYSVNSDTITIVKTLPGKIITNTIHIIDTIYRENTAALKLCDIERGKVIGLLQTKTAESDNWQGKAKKRFYIMWSLILIVVGFVGYRIYSMFKPKV